MNKIKYLGLVGIISLSISSCFNKQVCFENYYSDDKPNNNEIYDQIEGDFFDESNTQYNFFENDEGW